MTVSDASAGYYTVDGVWTDEGKIAVIDGAVTVPACSCVRVPCGNINN